MALLGCFAIPFGGFTEFPIIIEGIPHFVLGLCQALLRRQSCPSGRFDVVASNAFTESEAKANFVLRLGVTGLCRVMKQLKCSNKFGRHRALPYCLQTPSFLHKRIEFGFSSGYICYRK